MLLAGSFKYVNLGYPSQPLNHLIMKKTILTIVYFLSISILFAQVVVSPDFRIFPSTVSQSEVHVSINKTNPANILVSANTSINMSFSQSYYFSIDGGITWSGSDVLPNGGVGMAIPATDFDASGRGYLTTMARASGSGQDGYMVQYTDDRGFNWSNQGPGRGTCQRFRQGNDCDCRRNANQSLCK